MQPISARHPATPSSYVTASTANRTSLDDLRNGMLGEAELGKWPACLLDPCPLPAQSPLTTAILPYSCSCVDKAR